MDEIVRRLQKSRKSVISALKESMLLEKEEDEKDEEDPVEDEAPEEETPEEGDDIVSRMNRRASEEGESEESSDEEISMTDEEPSEPSDDSGDPVYPNPLDNPYAVHYTIGDKIRIVYATGSEASLVGDVDGYDTEGFYRIKWESGITTNGITDSAITELVKSVQDTNEGKCVCNSREFIMEGEALVCDNCGRVIKEFKDPLQKADKQRPRGKRMIRSEAHPINTHVPSIGETVKNAFSNSILNEEDDEDEDIDYQNVFASLSSLDNEFWTRLGDIVDDIEDLGYDVLEYNNEYIVIGSTDDEDVDHQLYVPIGGTSRTLTLELDKSREEIIR